MRRFVIRILLFATLVACFDYGIGVSLSQIRKMNKGGDVQRLANIMNNIDDSVIIMGSSRAVHHYVPNIIKKELGVSCYNCGFEGQGIIMHYAVWKELTKRYYPKILIYDVEAMFDLSNEFDNHRYLSRLKPFYKSNPSIDSVFWSVDYKEKWKMLARTYQYNSNFMDILAGWIHPIHIDKDNGYIPLEGAFNVEPVTISTNLNIQIDSLKLKYFKMLLQEASNKTVIIFVISPYYDCTGDGSKYESLRTLCQEYGCLFIDYSQDKDFNGKKGLFIHNDHLNDIGSKLYTTKIVKRIKNSINE